MGKQWLTLFFGGSKIPADGDSSHEIKRHLLLGRKVMTSLDSILKSRDITLPTKVLLVKAMVFPVVVDGCESWDCEESWALKNWCFWTVMLDKTFESPLDCKEIQPVHPKGNQFSSVIQSCLTLCNTMNRKMPGLPVYYLLPETTQTHVHWVSDAIQPSHPLSSPSPPAFNLSQH